MTIPDIGFVGSLLLYSHFFSPDRMSRANLGCMETKAFTAAPSLYRLNYKESDRRTPFHSPSFNEGKPNTTNLPITVRNELFDISLMHFPGVGYDASKPVWAADRASPHIVKCVR